MSWALLACLARAKAHTPSPARQMGVASHCPARRQPELPGLMQPEAVG
jgi:hypothetical protein